jgi:hypothetical protein
MCAFDRAKEILLKKPDQYKKEELAWVAGIVDGEGSLCILKTRDLEYNSLRFYLIISVRMSCKKTILTLRDIFDIGRLYQMKNKIERNRDSYTWSLSSRWDCEYVLNLIYPYLVTKKKHADIALQFLRNKKLISATKRPGNILWNSLNDRQINLFMQMQALNKSGHRRYRDGPKLEKSSVIRRDLEVQN